jgi:sporulation protein YlmC with PRC-barrel domain
MLKRALLSASAMAFAGGLAFAQAPAEQMRPMQAPSQGGAMTAPSTQTSAARLLASDIYKANVYDNSENKIGDVTDLIISNGNIKEAVIGVGGFLGAGQKDISVPFKELKISMRNGKEWLTLNRTKDELRSMPGYEPMSRPTTATAASPSLMNGLVSNIYKANVYDNSENKTGDVTDLIFDSEGNITTAVIGVGGVLGAGQKEVAVPLNELKMTSRDGKEWLILNRTKDDLKNAPPYDKKSETSKNKM